MNEWKTRGICAQTDPESFFPEKGGPTRTAKRICNGSENTPPCPVRRKCLDYALSTGQRYGIWGGMSERERRAINQGKPIEHVVPAIPTNRRANGHGYACKCRECQALRGVA